MKKILKFFAVSAVVMTAGMALQSCQSEAPFSNEGEGLVRLNVDVSSRVTRAVEGLDELKAKARIYISNEKGVLNKWVGVQSLPKDGFSLRYGQYLAEAFAGDSVAASFEKRYFKGSSPFYVGSEAASTQVTVTCKIANAVVSIDETTVKSDLFQDFKVVVENSTGSLTYMGETLLNYGYFMMQEGENSLIYTISGENNKGNAFEKKGSIQNVKAGYNYRLRFGYNPTEGDDGGAFLTVTVKEENFIEDEVLIHGRPVFSWVGDDPEIDAQVIGKQGEFKSQTLRVAAHNGFESITMKTDDQDISNLIGQNIFEVIGLTETAIADLNRKGLIFRGPERNSEGLYKYFIEFSSVFLNALPERDTEYVINMSAKDINGKSTSYDVRIANTDAAIVYTAPIIIDIATFESDLSAVNSRTAKIPVKLTNANVVNPQLQYRKTEETAWNSVDVNSSRADNMVIVNLRGLSPNSSYEYRVVAGELVDGKYDFESSASTFTTETEFVIPNASFEEWSSYWAETLLGTKDVILPGAGGDKDASFWGSGNEGAATANMTLTNKSEDMKHSGQYSARLESKTAMNVLAAGNIFGGTYVKTDGTNGVLSFGNIYDGSHPTKLRVWANYRPGNKVSVKKGNESFVPSGFDKGKDHGQIYVALTTGTVEIRTNPNDRKLFNSANNDSEYKVIGYGEVTWTDNFGADGSLEMVEIPINYTKLAKTVKPTHILIVVSASKYGDFFSGSPGSIMYLDDFELAYE